MLASVILEREEPVPAEVFAAEGLAIARDLADRWVLISSLGTMALTREDQQDFPHAASLHAEALGIAMEVGNMRLVAHCLEGVARAAIGAGETAPAVRLLGAAEILWEQQPDIIPQWGNPRETARLAAARDRARLVLGDGQFAATLAAGRTLAREPAAAEALALAAKLRSGAG
jgi:hypothetical protein